MSDPRRTGVFDIRQAPELEDLFKISDRSDRLSIRTCVIAKIVATPDSQPTGFDAQNQLVSVECQFPRVVKDRQKPGQTIVKDATILKNIPVYFPRSTTGGSHITFPLTRDRDWETTLYRY